MYSKYHWFKHNASTKLHKKFLCLKELHKEKIKALKKTVDVLTLTATPIPRTLHMSLIGIRDMSILSEAPAKRRPIQTYVMEYEPSIIAEAIRKELRRNGQVYYIHNRVSTITQCRAKIQKKALPPPKPSASLLRSATSELESPSIF